MINLLFPVLTKDVKNTISDEELVAEYIKSQNVAYFNILHQRYSAKIYAKSISMLKDEHQAHDAVQEIFMKILLNLSKFSGKSKFSTWVYSISYNFCIDLIRKRKRRNAVYVEDFPDVGGDDDRQEIDDKILLETKIEHLKVILEEISALDKAVLLMKYQDGMSIRDISEAFSKSESAVKMKIKRAKEKFVLAHKELFRNAS